MAHTPTIRSFRGWVKQTTRSPPTTTSQGGPGSAQAGSGPAGEPPEGSWARAGDRTTKGGVMHGAWLCRMHGVEVCTLHIEAAAAEFLGVCGNEHAGRAIKGGPDDVASACIRCLHTDI